MKIHRYYALLSIFMIIPIFSTLSSSQIVLPDERFLPSGDRIKVEVWIDNLRIPWSLVFLDAERALVSERAGFIRLIKKGKLQKEPYAQIEVEHIGEGGLMGLAIDPDYPVKPFIYAMHTYRKENSLYNRVTRLKDQGNFAVFDSLIIDNIPGGKYHDGGRIAFGPDRMLYITTGENFQARLAKDLNSLAGKILRITRDGKIPENNPFRDSPVFSYGHRNPQGISWQPGSNILFSSEHGPSGEFGYFGHDEINRIVKGSNYGWPEVIGRGEKKGYVDPLILWKDTTPPSGIAFYKGKLIPHLYGNLFVATLKSRSLVRIIFKGDTPVSVERWFTEKNGKSRYGRLRDVVEGPDGAIYFLSNNTDGRGTPKPGDDKIYRIIAEK